MAESLVLHPRATEPGRVRVWVGAFDRRGAPALEWRLDGAPAELDPIAPIESVRPVEDGWARVDEPRVFTGVYEFDGVTPGARVTVGVRADAGPWRTIRTRSLPDQVPSGAGEWFNVLLVSCYHARQDTGGAGRLVAGLPEAFRPHLTLLLGDQVYLDLFSFGIRFEGDEADLARHFELDYARNWRETRAYASVLGAAPSVAIPDDHEYWNNYPHAATILPVTWKSSGRAAWDRVARRMFERFQLHEPGTLCAPVRLDVPPLSFFVVDSRSCRERDRSRSVSPGALEALRRWRADLVESADPRYGVFATGQSFLEEGAGFMGRFADWKLPNYEDYEAQVEELQRIAIEGGRPLVTITGDVHWGRLTRARHAGAPVLYEVISSPTSLVYDPRNTTRRAWGAIRSLFGDPPDPAHLHPEPKDAPPELGVPSRPGWRMRTEERGGHRYLHGQRGNHVAILSFRRTGATLRMRVTYWQIDRTGGPAPVYDSDREHGLVLRPRPTDKEVA